MGSDDQAIWASALDSLKESTPPPQKAPVEQTPSHINSGSLVNTSEYRKDMDQVLNQELGNIYVNVPNFRKSYFCLNSLDHIARTVLERCNGDALFTDADGWTGWPQVPEQNPVLSWFSDVSEKLALFAKDVDPTLQFQRPLRLRTKPNEPIVGSTAVRMMDIGYVGFMDDDDAVDLKYHWSHVMIVGELKRNPKADTRSGSWLDLARYAREVLAAQDSRRFVLGFTLCGPLMRLWAFDRLGAFASERFDVNKDPLEFVSAVIGFLMMNNEQLGCDPTIITSNGQRYINVQHDGQTQTERLILEKVIFRQACIVGRATICWRAYRDGEEGNSKRALVVKNSWQYPERNEEGLMLQEASLKGVENIAEYYYHEVVQVGGIDDDLRSSVRKGLEFTAATVSSTADSEHSSPATSNQLPDSNTARISQRDIFNRNQARQSSSARGRKRLLSQPESRLQPAKRRSPMSTSASRNDGSVENRVHRRVIMQNYGKRICEASSLSAFLAGLEGCINGHESLRRKAGLLHRDISINNLMINEEEEDPSRRAFLIDLDLAIKETRLAASGAKRKTGTRAFMAIGALDGDQHSFMHDLESFFWVLYWICVHYNGPGLSIGATEYESWNYRRGSELATYKSGFIVNERKFLQRAESDFTPYYLPLVPWVNKLRKAVFPDNQAWIKENEGLYDG